MPNRDVSAADVRERLAYLAWVDEVADEAAVLAERFERRERRSRIGFIRRWYANKAIELRLQEAKLRAR